MNGGGSVLVIFPGALGDLILFVPALEEIARESFARPFLLCQRALAPLVEAAGLGSPIAIEGPEAAWLFSADPPREADIFFGAFDRIECFTGSAAPEVERNLRHWKGPHARVHPFRPAAARHLAVHFLEQVARPPAALPEVRLSFPAPIRPEIDELVHCGPTLVLHPGSGAPAKRWSRRGFLELAERWTASGGRALFVLGPAEADEVPSWPEALVVERPSLVELGAILERVAGYIGNDSGVSHLAAAAGARGVVLFGPTDPRLWQPLSRGLRVFSPSPWTRCDDVAPVEVISAVNQELRCALRGDRALTR